MSDASGELERYASSDFEVEIDCEEGSVSYHRKGFYLGDVAPRAFDALRRVLDLHNEVVAHPGQPWEGRFCEHDDQRYPCVTVQWIRDELKDET